MSFCRFLKNNYNVVLVSGAQHSDSITCVCVYCCCLVLKSCPTLCDPMDCSPPGSSVHRISQARILEWTAIFSSRISTTEPAGKPVNISIYKYVYIFFRFFSIIVVVVLVVQLCLTLCDPWTVAHQASLSMGFFRQEYWSGLSRSPPRDLP